MAVRNKGFLTGAVVGAGVAGAALAGIGLQWPQARADQELTPPTGQGMVRQVPPAGAPLSFADIIQRVSPAVVSIHATGRARPEQLRRQFGGLPFSFGPEGGIDPEDLPQSQSAGSGFFIRADGYIVTNNHVIEGADEITVRLSDDREFPARVVGRDESTDLAVLKVDGRDFPYVSFATERPARVGDWVIAVGNPFDLGGTVTAGIVSAYGRTLPTGGRNTYPVEYLQVDAPINRGNSGGPTFDTAGRVIGVNTAIFSDLPTGGSVGIGFAIPATLADRVTRQLITTGRFTRGYLGATILSLTPDVAEGLGLGRERRGAVVSELVPNGPAVRAGLQINDVILTFNGEPVRDNSDLTRRVGGVAAGETFRIGILRGGREQTLTVTSGTRPPESEIGAGAQPDAQGRSGDAPGGKPEAEPAAPVGTAVIGLTVAPVDAALRQQYQLDAQSQGLVITAVERGLRGTAAQLRAGDVILMVNGRQATSPAVFQAAVEEARRANRSTVALFIRTRGANGQAVNVAIGVQVNQDRPATPPAR